jgi:hypothetical protein
LKDIAIFYLRVTMIPMTQHIIACVHKLAQHEKIPEGIKGILKIVVTLYANSWLPGVVINLKIEKMKRSRKDCGDDPRRCR